MNKRDRELADAVDEKATHWHVVVLRRDGTLKVRKNLTRQQAKEAVRELAPNQRPKTFSMRPGPRGGYDHVRLSAEEPSAGDAVEVHVLGPIGAVLHAWAGVEPVHQDLAL